MHVRDASTFEDPKAIKVHQPREDPRNFYQSDEYLKKMAGKGLNNEVSFIYPGRDVIRANQRSQANSIESSHFDNYINDNVEYAG